MVGIGITIIKLFMVMGIRMVTVKRVMVTFINMGYVIRVTKTNVMFTSMKSSLYNHHTILRE